MSIVDRLLHLSDDEDGSDEPVRGKAERDEAEGRRRHIDRLLLLLGDKWGTSDEAERSEA